jgi:tetratricopeptide (TPR) repeat protein
MEEDDEKLKLIIGESKTRWEDTIISRGAHLFAKKEYQRSLECWLKVANSRAQKDLRYEEVDGQARCHYHLKQYEEAFHHATTLVALAPGDSAAWELHGTLHAELSHSLDRQLESFLRSLACDHPIFQVYFKIADIYRHLNFPHVVQYLLYRVSRRLNSSKQSFMYKTFSGKIDELKQWSESNTSTEMVSRSSFPYVETVVDLETRIFGPGFAKVASALSGSLVEEEVVEDVRDPSTM